jgi:hypothetical protein
LEPYLPAVREALMALLRVHSAADFAPEPFSSHPELMLVAACATFAPIRQLPAFQAVFARSFDGVTPELFPTAVLYKDALDAWPQAANVSVASLSSQAASCLDTGLESLWASVGCDLPTDPSELAAPIFLFVPSARSFVRIALGILAASHGCPDSPEDLEASLGHFPHVGTLTCLLATMFSGLKTSQHDLLRRAISMLGPLFSLEVRTALTRAWAAIVQGMAKSIDSRQLFADCVVDSTRLESTREDDGDEDD